MMDNRFLIVLRKKRVTIIDDYFYTTYTYLYLYVHNRENGFIRVGYKVNLKRYRKLAANSILLLNDYWDIFFENKVSAKIIKTKKTVIKLFVCICCV